MFMTVVRTKSHGVQMNGDTMFWGTEIVGEPDAEVRRQGYGRRSREGSGDGALPAQPRRAPSRYCGDVRVYGLTTTAMHD